jgi:gliding motility associated protien GldN
MKNLQLIGMFTLLFCVTIPLASQAQYNPNSVRVAKPSKAIFGKPITHSDMMYQTTVWRTINLREKHNKPFFAVENEITQVIMDGVSAGKLTPYPYSPTKINLKPMSKKDFLNRLVYSEGEMDYCGDDRLIAHNLYMLELKEHLIFDRSRSKMTTEIQSITMIIPQGTSSAAQLGDLKVATFKYKELYAYFKETYEKSQQKGTHEALRAFWFNPDNPRRHMSLADALELRLFSSRVTKVSNPDDYDLVATINQEYDKQSKSKEQKVLYLSQKIAYDLAEKEHNVWEY